MNELINDEAVYRTAPATPGLLKKEYIEILMKVWILPLGGVSAGEGLQSTWLPRLFV